MIKKEKKMTNNELVEVFENDKKTFNTVAICEFVATVIGFGYSIFTWIAWI